MSLLSVSATSTTFIEPTPLPFKYAVLDSCSRGEVLSSQLPTYKLPLQEEGTNQSIKSRICIVDDQNALTTNPMTDLPRTMVMMGATGAGKSTLIDGLVNYAYGVEWTDDFRFTIIDLKDEEKANRAASQAQTQTEWITTYVIRPAVGGKIAFQLRVVDMPGFGDTAGIEKDKELVKRLGELFAKPEEEGGIEQVDMVCLVVQASLARLTTSQIYIFNSIQDKFDKSIAENICAFITFSDGSTPPVHAALEQSEILFQQNFEFNNSVLYDRGNGAFAQLFWTMGLQSYRNVLQQLQVMETKSLRYSKEVFDERMKIQTKVVALTEEIELGLNNLEKIANEKKVLERYKMETKAKMNFTYEVTESFQVKEVAQQYAMNCVSCQKTCHYPCGVKADIFKVTCPAMSWRGKCSVCMTKCSTKEHELEKKKYIMKERRVTKTHEDMMKRYYDETQGGDKHQNMLHSMKKQFHVTQEGVKNLIDQIMDCQKKLSTLALHKSSPISMIEYLTMMRETENRNRRPGSEGKIKMLDDLIKEQELLANVENPNYNPWARLKDRRDILVSDSLVSE